MKAIRLGLRSSKHYYRSFSNSKASTRNSSWLLVGGGILIGSSLFWWKNRSTPALAIADARKDDKPKDDKAKFDKIRKEIETILDKNDYDDGSIGPVLVRLAWHASGTYDKSTGRGGSDGSTMRFAPESGHGANAGLNLARDFLEPIKKKFPEISYADLWTLAGVVAIEHMGGPSIPWKSGRSDHADGKLSAPDSNLPNASLKQDHVRSVFYRMGFNDREIVALLGCHCLGRCHTDRSGYHGPWTRAPTTVSNMFYKELLNNKWRKKNWKGPVQYEDEATGEIMMLPSDLALIEDPEFKKYVELYAEDEDLWMKDFSDAFGKLIELGVKRS
jgi:cytochrome c peroxidase